MKKIITILILSLSLATVSNAVAQENKTDCQKTRKEQWEKFRQDKHDFLTKTMELTPEQAEKFFPLFDEMEKKKFELVRDIHREARELMKADNVADEQYKAAANRAAAVSEKELAIEKEYYARFCEILTPRQQFLYHRCEPMFQKEISKKHRENKHGKACK